MTTGGTRHIKTCAGAISLWDMYWELTMCRATRLQRRRGLVCAWEKHRQDSERKCTRRNTGAQRFQIISCAPLAGHLRITHSRQRAPEKAGLSESAVQGRRSWRAQRAKYKMAMSWCALKSASRQTGAQSTRENCIKFCLIISRRQSSARFSIKT